MERMLWIAGLVALAALAMYGMWRGWVRRARRQERWLPEFPRLPEQQGKTLLSQVPGLYVGTTTADDWQNRIAVGDIGHRAAATATLRERGLLLERAGATPLWIPAAALEAARVDHKLANKVIPGAGMLVVTWRLGEHRLDTGFRVDGEPTQVDWAGAVRALVPTRHRTGDTWQEEQ